MRLQRGLKVEMTAAFVEAGYNLEDEPPGMEGSPSSRITFDTSLGTWVAYRPPGDEGLLQTLSSASERFDRVLSLLGAGRRVEELTADEPVIVAAEGKS